MRKNQIIYILCLISVTILVSYHGGTVSYALFYLCISIPIVAIAYNFYVYQRLQFYQHTPSKIVEKEKVLPYEVIFKNQDYIPFTHVKVKFYEEQCKVEESHKVTEYYLLPGDEKKLQTTLRCFYRGEYSVGVKEVEIMDFLYLFKITYPVMWSLELTVLPKVIRLGKLSILPNFEDPKVSHMAKAEDVLLESDTRKYQPGDSLKQIHWKAVARQGELLTRRMSTEVKRETIIVMDQSAVLADGYQKLAIEDKVLEIVLAITFYLQEHKVGSTVCYEEQGRQHMRINTPIAFGEFYQLASKFHFNSEITIENQLETYLIQHPKPKFCILVCHKLSAMLYEKVYQALLQGQQMVLIYVSNDKSEEEARIQSFEAIGIKVYWIRPGDSLEAIIGA